MNKNQEIVLNWLIEVWKKRERNGWTPFHVVGSVAHAYDQLHNDRFEEPKEEHLKAYGELTSFELFEVMSEFCE